MLLITCAISLGIFLSCLYASSSYVRAQCKVISIEGNIGSGKTTLIQLLSKRITSPVLEEPVSLWNNVRDESGRNVLQAFYADKTRVAFVFQMLALFSRFEMLISSVKSSRRVVVERSIHADRYVFAETLFKNGYMTMLEHTVYLLYCNYFIKQLPEHVMIYLDTAPTECLHRIKLRGRAGEEGITLQDLEELRGGHDVLLRNAYVPVYRLNGLLPPQDLCEQVVRILELV